MNERVTLTEQDQVRLLTIGRLDRGDRTAATAAAQLGCSVRQVRRILAAYRKEGAASIPHGNRGRQPAHTLDPAVRQRVTEVMQTTYAGVNDSHLRDLLEEREGLVLSRASVQRLRQAAAVSSPRQRRPPQHRQRRERRPQAGMLLQLDGSPHDWLEGRGPRATLLAAIDDATGQIAGAVWREEEDGHGYLALLEQIVTAHGRPEAVYHDRSGIFVHHDHDRETVAEQLAGEREPRQVGRALAELGIASITAHSPQAKGRVERLFGTLQDRLVVELRLAGAATIEAATAVLGDYLPRFNARFAVPAAQDGAAYRALAPGMELRQVCCFKHRRTVANDDTIQFNGRQLQLLAGPERVTYVRATVEVREHLDGTLSVWYQERAIATRAAVADARTRRRTGGQRAAAGVGAAAAAAAPPPAAAFNLEAEDRADLAPPPASPPPAQPWKPARDHPWR